jgi:DNA-binding NarL/FixJ family response regulator
MGHHALVIDDNTQNSRVLAQMLAKQGVTCTEVQNAPIIAYTVHLNEIANTRQLGFDGFLGKPLDVTRFPEQLARILRGEQLWERN